MSNYYNDQWRLPNNENKDKQSNYSIDKFDLNDYISTPLTIDEFSSATMSIWFKTSLSQSDKYFLTFPESSGANGFDLNFVTSGIKSYLEGHSGSNNITSTFTYNDGNWHHVIVSYSGTNHKMYIDGVLTASSSATVGTIKNAEGNLYIGALSSLYPTYRVSQTKLDQVAVFNYALSDGNVSVGQTATGQIATLYGGGSAVSNPMSLSPAPVAYYPLGDQDAFNGADYLVPNSSLKDYVFDFNNSQEINCGNDSSLQMDTVFTMSCWINTTSTSRGSIMGTFITNGYYIDLMASGTVQGGYHSTGSHFLRPSSSTVNDGNWHHICYVISGTATDGSDLDVYVDGQLDNGSFTSSGTPSGAVTTNPFKINLQGYSGRYTGKTSNVQVFNTELPATGSNSVETLYNNGSPLTSMSGFTSLQGWWKLDASATYDSSTTTWTIPDDSSNSNDGTSSGMTQSALQQSDLSFKTSYSPYALLLDGANDYINCGNDNSLVPSSQITLSLWFKTSGSASAIPRLINKSYSAAAPYDSYFIRINNGVLNFKIGVSSASVQIAGTTNVVDGNWHNVIGTYDGSQLKLYLDGNSEATPISETRTIIENTSYNLTLGCEFGAYGFSWPFTGSMSNVSIWNAGLTSAQVTEIYNEGVPSNLNNHSAYSNLVSWWQLGSNTSWVDPYWIALDEKGTNNGESQNVAAPNNMGENAIVDGVGSYANGLSNSMGGDEVIGDAPYSSSNSLSVNMDVEDRTTDTPS